jgi:hypothetical protein
MNFKNLLSSLNEKPSTKPPIVNIHDHAKLKNEVMFCNSIMWFIFNLQKKNKLLEIAAKIYTYIQVVYG